MTGTRNLLYFLMAVVLGAFALPSSAADKLFSLNSQVYTNDAIPVLFGVIPNGSTAIVVVDFFNQSPGGNSVFNSIKLDVAADVKYSIINTVTKNSGSCPAPAHTTITPSSGPGGTIQLNGINGAKPNGHFCIYLAATSVSNACAPALWTGYANTGNSFNGVPFFDTILQSQPYSKMQTIDGCEGTLACGETRGDTDPVLDGTPSKAISRDFNTNNPDTCTGTALIGYSLNLDVSDLNNQITTFITFKNGQAFAVEYVLVWAPVFLNQVDDLNSLGAHTSVHTGLPNFVPRVAWLQDGGNYVPLAGLACLGTDVSDPAIMPTLPASVPPPYVGGTPAKMCIAGVEWAMQPDGKIQYLVRVIDQTDSRVFGP